MKNLYIIVTKNTNLKPQKLFQIAAKARKISLHTIYTEEFDFTKPQLLTKNDGLYRISTNPQSSLIEKLLINNRLNTFYTNYQSCIGRLNAYIGSALIHKKLNLPIIPTIFTITNEKTLLKKYVNYLDGFPIIIKSIGGMRGVGVMKIDSFESLISICDYLSGQDDKFIMRKYIPHDKQARLIVVGDQVVASKEYFSTVDFRTNVGDGDEIQKTNQIFDDKINQIAIKAVHTLNYEFGGVDILFHSETNEPYIAEVNFPCNFAGTQQQTDVDIAGAMIDHLIAKSEISSN